MLMHRNDVRLPAGESPLTVELALQRRARHLVEYDTESSHAQLAKRMGVGLERFKRFLTNAQIIPGVYRLAASRINQSAVQVMTKREAGFDWCGRCKDWFPMSEFASNASTTNPRHRSSCCTTLLGSKK